MKSTLAVVAIAVAAVAGLDEAAHAADWNGAAGGIKDYGRAGVPVPAPIPVPDYAAKWYFRLDAGIGFISEPSISESGLLFGTTDSPGAAGPTPFGSSPSWFAKDYETSVTWGLGAGYYWSSRVRTDLTADVRSQQSVKGSGSYRYDQHSFTGGPPPVYGPVLDGAGNPIQILGSVTDNTMHRSGTVLFNLYYDLFKHGAFTPYVGAGIGVAFHEFERTHRNSASACDTNLDPTCAAPVLLTSASVNDKSHAASLAWALMAGMSYNIGHSTLLDVNYRYLNIGSTSANLSGSGVASKISIGEQSEHQLRAGLRFDIN
jgi:opacity protein-like surface antigen